LDATVGKNLIFEWQHWGDRMVGPLEKLLCHFGTPLLSSKTLMRICLLSFGCRRCRCPSGLQKMLILLFTILLSWPYLL